MRKLWIVILSLMLFVLPIFLFFSREYVLAQVLFFSQLIVLWGALPFLFRQEHKTPREWNRQSLLITFVAVVALVSPFLIHLDGRASLESTDILQSTVRMFSDTAEMFLVLGVCLSAIFVIAVLIKRRGYEA